MTTNTAPYNTLTYIQAGITIRVDFYANGTIKNLGTPEYYSIALNNMAGSPSISKAVSASKINSTTYRINTSATVGVIYNPTYTGSFTKNT